jgi:hypothetical protein
MTNRPFADGAAVWRAAGWMGTLPLPARKKSPPPDGYTGWDAPDPTDDTVENWRRRQPGGNLAIRLPVGVVGIDVDHYDGKSGADSLARLEALHGPLPATVISTSRTPPSGIRLYRIPEGVRLHGFPMIDGRKVGDIEIIQRGHRYLGFGIHPSGNWYRLLGPGGEPLDGPPRPEGLPDLPEAWVQGQRVDRPQPVQSSPAATGAGERHKVVDQVLNRALADMFRGGRHDAAAAGVLGLLNLKHRGWPGADDALDELRTRFLHAVTADGSRGASEAEAEYERMLDGGEEKIRQSPPSGPNYEPPRPKRAPLTAFAGANALAMASDPEGDEDHDEDEEPAPAATLSAATNLPAPFWESRPILGHIRQAAHSRNRSGDAVLCAVLARVAAYLPHTLQLPPIVGGPGSLNWYGIPIGGSGTGKSSAIRIGAELVPCPQGLDVADDRPLGSGEGVAEAYMGSVDETEDGRTVKVRKQVRYNALIRCDEGEALTELLSRKGSTLLETLRRGWTGDTLGQANAAIERTRVIPDGQYRLGLVIAFQPEKAGELLGDDAGGTPQRFCWFSSVDPSVPDESPEWPGPLPWRPPTRFELRGTEIQDRGYARHRMTVADTIARRIRAADLAQVRGEAQVADPLDTHASFHRLKLAALFAILDDRLDVTEDDWKLADIVWETSRAVRTSVKAAVAAEAERDELVRVRKHARREQAAEVARKGAGDAVERLARRLARYVHGRPGDGFTRGALGRRLKGSERDLIDHALAAAVEFGWLGEADGEYVAGESRPA